MSPITREALIDELIKIADDINGRADSVMADFNQARSQAHMAPKAPMAPKVQAPKLPSMTPQSTSTPLPFNKVDTTGMSRSMRQNIGNLTSR